MKSILLAATLVSTLSIGCNKTEHENSATADVKEEVHSQEMTEAADDNHSVDNTWVNQIKLDDGSKWQANRETTEGVDRMLGSVKSADPTTVQDYHALASNLAAEKNVVIQKCTMEGASHDNLHIFLHPLLEKIAALGDSRTIDEGAKIKASIQENLEMYNHYFQ